MLFIVFWLQFQTLNLAQTIPQSGSTDAEFCSKDLEKKKEKRSGDYLIRISYANSRMCQHFDIFKNDRTVFHEEGDDNHYFFGSDDRGTYTLGNLTGHGIQLVVRRWTGGAHCCTSLLIFDLGNDFRKIAEIDGGNFEPEIADLDHDGIPEIRVRDDFLAYRFSDFAHSAIAEVILKYGDGQYSVAPEFMRKPLPSRQILDATVASWKRLLQRKKTPNWPPPPLIQALTDLVYAGSKQTAFALLDRAWPMAAPGRSEFLASYRVALNESKYYAEFEKKQ
ncbi:MAG: hypothetical protein C5B49_11415 [Bdellovibrio sp.]|nr:MAG: hypothetical protein C5B49_11415 [Bdellovibrio sp.]